MSCLDNIVTLGICPDDGESLSGFTLKNSPGISLKNLADITTDNNVSGAAMALEVKKRTLLQVRNDFIGALQSNKIIPVVSQPVYQTAIFDPGHPANTYPGYRGTTIFKNTKYRGTLRKTILESVQLYPLGNGDTTLKITDGNVTYTYPITVVANQVNVFDENSLDGFPLAFDTEMLKVTVDQTTIPFASAKISCMIGCNGTLPNPCGYAEGWGGDARVKSEGFGVNLVFKCECDYERILCDLAKSFIGEIIWLKWRYNIFEEQYNSNRFTSWVIYNREDLAKQILPDLNDQYVAKWNAFMAGLFSTLQTYRDECLDCRGIRWKTNV